MTRPDDKTLPPQNGVVDIDDLRRALARKLEAFVRDWRRCARPACKRKRGCVPPASGCCAKFPERRVTDEEWARQAPRLRRMLRKRLAEIAPQQPERSQPEPSQPEPSQSPRGR